MSLYWATSKQSVLKVDAMKVRQMGKSVDLSDSDDGQMVKAKRVGKNISNMFMGCSLYAVVSIYQSGPSSEPVKGTKDLGC